MSKKITEDTKTLFTRKSLFWSSIALGFIAFGASISVGAAGITAHYKFPGEVPLALAGLGLGLLAFAATTLVIIIVGFYRRDTLIQWFGLFCSINLWPAFIIVGYFVNLLSTLAATR